MMSSPFPSRYEEWLHCITVECGIALTPEYVEERLSVWRDEQAEETQRFRRLYGDDYWQFMMNCFERAKAELATRPS
ncbi:MAG: hypothetical protein AAF542_19900 [Pseudomonadota bacterium]